MKKNEKTIQELTDQFCREIDALFTAKKKRNHDSLNYLRIKNDKLTIILTIFGPIV